MNTDEMNQSQWRSIDHDDSITEPIKFEPEQMDENMTKDILTLCHNSQDNRESSVVVESELLSAMSKLQIASAKKIRKFRDPKMSIQSPLNNAVQNTNSENDNPIMTVALEEIQNDAPNDVKSNLEIPDMIVKAQKLLTPQPTKMKPPSPRLQLNTSNNSTLNCTMNNTTMNQSTAGLSDKIKSNHIVKTIADTKCGIQLKEEKINYFGIPVTLSRKKRTEAKPFSFASRTKSTESLNQQAPKSSTTSKPVGSSATLQVPQKPAMPARSNTSDALRRPLQATKSSLTSATLASKAKIVAKLRQNDKRNQENKTPNVSTIGGTKVKTKPVVVAPPTLHSEKRAKDRQEFDAKLKQRELEMEQMRALAEERKREKERLAELNLRKAMELKAKPMPVFKVPAPIRSNKPLTEPHSPAWALKSKINK